MRLPTGAPFARRCALRMVRVIANVMHHHKIAPTALALVLVFSAQVACAQFFVPWTRSPSVTVVTNGDDPRFGLVEEGITFWNKTLEELGSGFRLGALTQVDQPIPEEALQSVSRPSLAQWAVACLGFPRP